MKINERFELLKNENRNGLIIYLTAGCPDISFTENFIIQLEQTGVDFIEIGVPFSDPIADGPVIQKASQEALKNKVNLVSIFEMCKRLKRRISIPYLLMSYFNPVFRYGLENFAKDSNECGVSGVIIPDLPFEESLSFRTILDKYNVDQILFISSTTSLRRREMILKAARGFIYYIAVHGVTGIRDVLPDETYQDVANLRKKSKVPVAVGFGISNQQQVKRLKGCADGIIIGSYVMKEIMAGNHEFLLETLKNFLSILKSS
ncbi:MAG: tryptophan synthase subunit alpha [Candidatus Omnitrophica bacterium]|nr:tryptophan synthase subunit alpha [Candidatus Omnitrophota bacterium]MCM8817776.1 tryptophan synthase subunit alpha [Candidatus Omnitrophota bacterium]